MRMGDLYSLNKFGRLAIRWSRNTDGPKFARSPKLHKVTFTVMLSWPRTSDGPNLGESFTTITLDLDLWGHDHNPTQVNGQGNSLTTLHRRV